MPETIDLFGSTRNKITKTENGKNVRNLEIIEVVLVHSNTVDNNYQRNSKSCIHLSIFLKKCWFRIKIIIL